MRIETRRSGSPAGSTRADLARAAVEGVIFAIGAAAGLLDPDDVDTLGAAWRLATRVRNGIVLARGRAADSLPSDHRELSAVARAVGYPAGHTADLVED